MWQIYLLDISQNITKLGVGLICISFILSFIGGMTFIESNFSNRSSDSFKEKRIIAGYLFIASGVFFVLGVLMTTITPSEEVSKYLIDQIKLEK